MLLPVSFGAPTAPCEQRSSLLLQSILERDCVCTVKIFFNFFTLGGPKGGVLKPTVALPPVKEIIKNKENDGSRRVCAPVMKLVRLRM